MLDSAHFFEVVFGDDDKKFGQNRGLVLKEADPLSRLQILVPDSLFPCFLGCSFGCSLGALGESMLMSVTP